MRQLATLPRDQARLLADHLLTLSIQTRLDDEPGGVAVWVCDEDQVARARQELAEFQKNPQDARYRAASRTAQAIRDRSEQDDTDYQERQRDFSQQMRRPEGEPGPPIWTVLLLLISVLVAGSTSLGEDKNSPVLKALWIAPAVVDNNGVTWDRLNAITERNEWWRLVTPIFIHYGAVHLIFNMACLIVLGTAVERRIGSGAFLGLVLLIAVPSNLASYYFHFGADIPGFYSLQPNPLGGGMSGVLYGLFGFLWVRSWQADDVELVIPQQWVSVMLVWLVVCMTGVIGRVGNTAHVVGLLIGMGVGLLVNVVKKQRNV
jgi:GlpG protein